MPAIDYDQKLTTHFTLVEALRPPPSGQRIGYVQTMTPQQLERARWLAVHLLEPIRVSLNKRMFTGSWFRDSKMNTLAKGAKHSAHLEGRAWDGEADGMSNLQFAQHVRTLHIEYDKLILEYPSADDPRAGWVHLQCARLGGIARREVYTAKVIDGETKFIPGLTI